ncbi:unnamed protein product [Euphydryas editha]|uniref:Roadblock/LAMTOR2 domain-containing protein n=1 Tax=Euphydryas editha TaxID=104508 RepID=A0AAU9UE60_EUPED|nr:unnamed protein product [Euphydryas editha]
METYKKRIFKKDIPTEFDESTFNTINRIEENSNVIGLMHFRDGFVQLSTAPEAMTQTLTNKLPALTSAFQWSVGEIDILDELVAYRIVTNTIEIMAVANKEFTSCVVHKSSKRREKKS